MRLYQFALRLKLIESIFLQSRIKPEQQKVELHLQLDVESKNFNNDLAQKFAAKTPKTGIDPKK